MTNELINNTYEEANQDLPKELQAPLMPVATRMAPKNKYGGLKGNRKERRRQLAIVKRAIKKGLNK